MLTGEGDIAELDEYMYLFVAPNMYLKFLRFFFILFFYFFGSHVDRLHLMFGPTGAFGTNVRNIKQQRVSEERRKEGNERLLRQRETGITTKRLYGFRNDEMDEGEEERKGKRKEGKL